jgi:hypothetical protein
LKAAARAQQELTQLLQQQQQTQTQLHPPAAHQGQQAPALKRCWAPLLCLLLSLSLLQLLCQMLLLAQQQAQLLLMQWQ